MSQKTQSLVQVLETPRMCIKQESYLVPPCQVSQPPVRYFPCKWQNSSPLDRTEQLANFLVFLCFASLQRRQHITLFSRKSKLCSDCRLTVEGIKIRWWLWGGDNRWEATAQELMLHVPDLKNHTRCFSSCSKVRKAANSDASTTDLPENKALLCGIPPPGEVELF